METMQFHITKMDFFRTIFFLHLSGRIEQIGVHKKLSKLFHVGKLSPGVLVYSMVFSLIFKFSLIFMNMQMRYFYTYDHWMKGLAELNHG